MILSGSEFKERYPGPYYNVMKDDLTNKGFTYQLGLNVVISDFYIYEDIGLCFFNNSYSVNRLNFYLSKIGIIEIPDDALVYHENQMFETNKMILSEIISDEDKILDFLEEFKDNISRRNNNICTYAAKNGHLEVLKWARENDFPWDEKTCANAAKNGHLEVLKWARENGCPWDEKTCIQAAKNGHLEVLKWAKENGCPWDS